MGNPVYNQKGSAGAAPHTERNPTFSRVGRSRPADDLHAECEAKIDELDEKLDAALRTLHDLKSHVENLPVDTFRYPDIVADLMSRADTLLDGEVPATTERKRELEAENGRLRTALRKVRRHANKYQSEEEPPDFGRLWLIAHRALDAGGENA